MENELRVSVSRLFEKIIISLKFHFSIEISLFNVDNHIIVHPSNYRGRSVNESNIQDYISNIVSKYMPSNLPPWQIGVIPILGTAPTTIRLDDVASTSSQSLGNDVDTEQQLLNDSLSVINKMFLFHDIISYAYTTYL